MVQNSSSTKQRGQMRRVVYKITSQRAVGGTGRPRGRAGGAFTPLPPPAATAEGGRWASLAGDVGFGDVDGADAFTAGCGCVPCANRGGGEAACFAGLAACLGGLVAWAGGRVGGGASALRFGEDGGGGDRAAVGAVVFGRGAADPFPGVALAWVG